MIGVFAEVAVPFVGHVCGKATVATTRCFRRLLFVCGGGGGDLMHGRSHMTIDPRIPTLPGGRAKRGSISRLRY